MKEIEVARTYLQTLLAIERAPQAQLDAYQQELMVPTREVQCALLQPLSPNCWSAPTKFTGMERLTAGLAP